VTDAEIHVLRLAAVHLPTDTARVIRTIVAQRAAATAARALNQTVDGLSEVGVDDAVQDKVDGEVHRLQKVSDRLRHVEDIRVVGVADGALREEVEQFRRDEQNDEEDDDDDECQSDASGRPVAVVV